MRAHQQWRTQRARGEVRKGLLAGVLGGLVACWAMNQCLAFWKHVIEGNAATETEGAAEGRRQLTSGQGGQLAREGADERRPPTMIAAAALAAGLGQHPLTTREQRRVGQVLHYSMGTVTGALYGALAEKVPIVTTALGVLFGVAVWLLADEIAVPALGLSKPPAHQDLSTHTYALASHSIYGLTTELARRCIRWYF
jgi:Protein of unknown function (DUF1440)